MAFTKERIQNAFEVAQIKPIRGRFVSIEFVEGKQQNCGCAISALLVAEKNYTFEQLIEMESKDGFDYNRLGESFDVDYNYIASFIAGYDSMKDEDDLESSAAKEGRATSKLLGFGSWEDGL